MNMSYDKSAMLYDRFIAQFKNYANDSAKLAALAHSLRPNARSALEVCCGTGLYLEPLREHFEVQGLDLSAAMLAIARERVPEVPLYCGSMVDFDLGRRFDVVCCLFSSIAYARTADGFESAISCMARHLQPDGVLLIEPFFSPESFWLRRVTMNCIDDAELKASWIYVSEREGDEARLTYHYTVGTPAGVEHFTEMHALGLFSKEQYASAFARLGLMWRFDPVGLAGRGLYVASRQLPAD